MIALVLTAAGLSRAEPCSDLMNSIHRMRLEGQKRAKADVATSKPASAGITYWSWSRVRNITAGQSSVAVPELSQRTVVEPMPGDFKTARNQKSSEPRRRFNSAATTRRIR